MILPSGLAFPTLFTDSSHMGSKLIMGVQASSLKVCIVFRLDTLNDCSELTGIAFPSILTPFDW
jgi:hypothetical protein